MPSQAQRIELLQATPFFGAVSDQTISFILEHSETLHKKAGEYFFRQSELGDSLFLLEQGRAVIFKESCEQEYILRQVSDGQCFGELALIDFTSRSASVRAETDCQAIRVSSAALHGLYQSNSEQFLIIQMNMAREVSRRLRESDERWFRLQCDQL